MPNPKGINQYTGGGGGKKSAAKKPAKKKEPKGGSTVLNVTTGKQISKVDAAAKMFGVGSAKHKAALKKWG